MAPTGPLKLVAVRLLQADRAWEGGLVENPAMTRLADRYHLLYSGNLWETERYATGHARCASPVGPCTKTSRDAPAFTGSGATVARSRRLSFAIRAAIRGNMQWRSWSTWTRRASPDASAMNGF